MIFNSINRYMFNHKKKIIHFENKREQKIQGRLFLLDKTLTVEIYTYAKKN